jgi:hypothetical protein
MAGMKSSVALVGQRTVVAEAAMHACTIIGASSTTNHGTGWPPGVDERAARQAQRSIATKAEPFLIKLGCGKAGGSKQAGGGGGGGGGGAISSGVNCQARPRK